MRATEAAPALLAAFAKQLEAQGIDLPERQYVAPGNLIPWDGEQIVVVLQQIEQGQPGAPFAQTYSPVATIMWAQFAVAIVREIPALNNDGPLGSMIPDSPELGASGLSSMADAEALVEAGIAIHQAHTVTEAGMGFVVGPCAPVGPEGGLAGHRLLVDISLA